VHDLWRKRICW